MSSEKPTFSVQVTSLDCDTTEGMNLRDWFAGQALAMIPGLCDRPQEMTPFEISQTSYRIADAMMVDRKKQSEDKSTFDPGPMICVENELQEALAELQFHIKIFSQTDAFVAAWYRLKEVVGAISHPRYTRERVLELEESLMRFTEPLLEHPEDYDGPCACAECRSYE